MTARSAAKLQIPVATVVDPAAQALAPESPVAPPATVARPAPTGGVLVGLAIVFGVAFAGGYLGARLARG